MEQTKPESIIALNTRWRVVDLHGQWILQHRKNRKTKKGGPYRARSYHLQRSSLLRCIQNYCGSVDNGARRTLKALPNTYRSHRYV